MTRKAKTPRQRAQEQLDVATRHVDRLTKKSKARDYLKNHPDLAQEGPSTTTRTTSTGDTK